MSVYFEPPPDPFEAAVTRDCLPARGSLPALASAHALGRFLLLHPIGRGTFGVVWRAHDPVLGRDVALKLPHPLPPGDPRGPLDFLQEARAGSQLDHVNLVPVYEAGEIDGVRYIAMPFVEGETLLAWLRRQDGPVPFATAARLLLAVADGVHQAHECGFLHRDLKPSNILMQPRPPGEEAEGPGSLPFTPRVTDFGLARPLALGEATFLSGLVVGTPQYMAPEQARGDGRQYGRQLDVYALGVIFYELLTGRVPFQGASQLEVLRQVVEDEPPRPALARPGLPRDLAAILRMCLEKGVARRYATAAELAADLRRFLGGQTTVARPLHPAERACRWVRRRPTRAALLAMTALFALTLVSGLLTYGLRMGAMLETVQDQRDRAERGEEAVREKNEALSEQVYAYDMRFLDQSLLDKPGYQDLWLIGQRLRDHVPAPGARDRREFSWYHLHYVSHGDRPTFAGPPGNVYCCQLTRDGRTLVTAGEDRAIRVWDAATGAAISAVPAHAGDINDLALDPGGAWVASCGDDGLLSVRELPSGNVLRRLEKFARPLHALERSADGRRLIATDGEGVIKYWDTTTWQVARTLPAVAGGVRAIRRLDPEASRLAIATGDNRLLVWDVSRPAPEQWSALKAPNRLRDIAVSPNGRWLAVSDSDGPRLTVWEVATKKVAFTRTPLNHGVGPLRFTPDQRWLLAGDNSGVVTFINTSEWREKFAVRLHGTRIWGLNFTPRGAALLTSSSDGTTRSWSMGRLLATPVHGSPVSVPDLCASMAVSPAHRSPVFVLGNAPEGRLYRFDPTPTWRHRAVRTELACAQEGGRSRLAISPDGRQLAVGCSRQVRVYHAGTLELLTTLPPDSTGSDALAFSPDGELLATSGQRGRVTVWDWRTGRVVRECPHPDIVDSVAFAPTAPGSTPGGAGELATACNDFGVRLWPLPAHPGDPPAAPRELLAHTGDARVVAYSPDGRWLVSGSNDDSAILWDRAAGRVLRHLVSHQGPVTAVAFPPAGPGDAVGCVATGSVDQTVKLWQLPSGRELTTLRGHHTAVANLAYAANGQALVSMGDINSGKIPPGQTRQQLFVWPAPKPE